MYSSTFRHKEPPLAAQWMMGLAMYGPVRGLMWALEKSGYAALALRKMGLGRFESQRKKNPFLKYQLGPQDVMVMTYAKSGTNWTMQIALQLIYHAQAEFDHVHNLVPWPDTEIIPPMKHYAIPFPEAQHWQDAPEKLRVIKTHYNWDLIPYTPEARYIACIRDPKDVFVSSYFFVKPMFGPSMPSVDTWYKLFLSGGALLGASWAVNAAGYWAERHRPNVLVLSFKEMKRDHRASVVEIAKFLNIDASDALIDEVTRLSTFAYMKSIDDKFSTGRMQPWGEHAAMMRKGTQGGSSELLTPEMQREIDRTCIAELKALGSDFPYERFCELAK